MKFLLAIYESSTYWDEHDPERDAREDREHSAFVAWLKANDITHVGHALTSPETARTFRRGDDGSILEEEGPFQRDPAMIAGFYLFDAPDLDAARAIARRCPYEPGFGGELRAIDA